MTDVSQIIADTIDQKVNEKVDYLTQENGKLREKVDALQGELDTLKKSLSDVNGLAKSHEGNAKANSERARSLLRQVDNLQREIQIVQRQLDVERKKVLERDQTIEKLKKDNATLRNDLLVASKTHPIAPKSETPTDGEPAAPKLRRSQRS